MSVDNALAAGLLAGLAIGIVVGLLIARLRQRPDAAPPGMNTLTTSTLSSPSGAAADASSGKEGHEPRVFRGRREIVKRRTEAKVTPDGLTITVDGREFHLLAAIPDSRLADEVRALLVDTATSVTDPATRERLEQELRDAGIEPGG
jgi:hypothetical protein